MKKKILCACLAMALCTGLMAGCSGSQPAPASSSAPASSAPASSAPAGKADTGKKELTIFSGLRSNVESLENNRFTDYYEELTGVHVNWITYVDEIPTQFNLSIASGDYPDIYTYNWSRANLEQAISAGAAIPIEDLLAENAPNYMMLMEKDPDLRAQMTAPDGHIYSFPDYNALTNYMVPQRLWIFEPWLEASGMQMPTTLDELYKLLCYFRDNDMNGNGDPNDEYPMQGSSMILGDATDPMIPIIGCFETVTGNWMRADENGKVWTMATTDNYREGLKYANFLFEEGLISPETYTQNINTHRESNSPATDEQNFVGVSSGPEFARFVTAAYPNRYKTWTWIPPLKKDAESQPKALRNQVAYTHGTIITTACKDPALAVQWLDKGLDPEIQIMSAYGFEDEHWKRISEDANGTITFQLTDKSLYKEGAATQNITWSLDWWEFPHYISTHYMPYVQQFEEGTDAWYQNKKEKESYDAYLAVSEPGGFPAATWATDADLDAERTELATLLEEYIKTSYTEFIMGTRDIDDDAVWQEYKDKIADMGMERYIEVLEQYYFAK